MTIPLDQAELLALFLENITYGLSCDPSKEILPYLGSILGAFLSLFNLLVVISLGERNIHFSKQRFILPVATLMMLLATMVSVWDIQSVYQFSSCLVPASYHWFRPCSGGICYWRSRNFPSPYSVLSSYFPTSSYCEDTGLCSPNYSWGYCTCEVSTRISSQGFAHIFNLGRSGGSMLSMTRGWTSLYLLQ